ncbi:MAG: DNA polymerase III subunit delta [Gammaproteobacteria bacterium]
MRITSDALPGRLQKGLDRGYLIFGAEPLLIEESADAVREAARTHGVDEILRFTAGVDLDWEQIGTVGQALSLFATRRLLEIRLPTGKPGESGARALTEFLEEADDSVHLCLILGRTDKSIQSAKWFKAVESVSTAVEARAVTSQQLPGWIKSRLATHGVKATQGAIDRLAYYSEGNLLFAAQEISKLPLVLDGETLDEVMLDSWAADQARFSVFALVDVAMNGQPAPALRMLQGLKREGTEPILINWALAREVRVLYEMAKDMSQGADRRRVFERFRVWRSRERCIGAALQRLDMPRLGALLQQLALNDRVIKGHAFAPGGVWAEIERAILLLCGIKVVQRKIALNY